MEQKQWSVNLICIEQRTLIYKQLAMTPRIAVGHAHLAIVVAPIAHAPIAGVIGDTSMRDGCSKDIRLSLQILSHESTIRCTHTTNLFCIDERMSLTYLLCTLDDVISRTTTCSVDMARCPLLTKTCGTTWLNDISHIAQRVPILRRVR